VSVGPEIHSRLEELIDFCREVGYRRMEVICCHQQAAEGREMARILSRRFIVGAACCRICAAGGAGRSGSAPPGAGEDLPTRRDFIEHLRQSVAELFVDAGLCATMEVLLNRYSPVPATTLAVRDPRTAHDPLGMLKSPSWRQKFGLP